jgi:small subunit ribosomal protein S16
MALKIRLKQLGRRNRPFYRLVVTDVRNPRDGAVVETVGWYNPHEAAPERHLSVKNDRVQHWMEHGAELTEKAEQLVRRCAPELVRAKLEREAARRRKEGQKRRARRQKKAAA